MSGLNYRALALFAALAQPALGPFLNRPAITLTPATRIEDPSFVPPGGGRGKGRNKLPRTPTGQRASQRHALKLRNRARHRRAAARRGHA